MLSSSATAGGLGVSSTGVPPAAIAGLELRWQAPPECPTTVEILKRVRAHVGGGNASSHAQVSAHVERQGDGYRLSIEVQADVPLPSREIPGLDCDTLASATALIAAAALDPIATERRLHQPPVVLAVADGPVVPVRPATATRSVRPHTAQPRSSQPREPPTTQSPSSPAERPRHIRAILRPEVGLGGGELPGVGPSQGLVIGVGGRHWNVELGGAQWLPRQRLFGQAPEIGIQLELTTAVLRGCGTPSRGRWSLPICAGIEAGRMIGTSHSDDRGADFETGRGREAWVATVLGAGARFSLIPGLALIARGEAAIALRRPSFYIEKPDTVQVVHTAQPVAGRGFVGIELRFPW